MDTVTLVPGEKRRLFSGTPPTAQNPWYVNDHTLVRDRAGTWHAFGIWHPEPADPLDETFFLHATAPELTGEWTLHDPVMHARTEIGETHVWAPHVIEHEGQYLMFYCGGTRDHERYRIDLAVSDDLFSWRHPSPHPLFEDGFDARDPMVLRDGDGWLLYYTRTSRPGGGNHEVAVRRSDDLRTWSEPTVCYRSDETGTVGGPTESPFVVRVGASVWLLFVCESGEYDRTLVYGSDNPLAFSDRGRLDVDLDEHCAEIVDDGERLWITGGGWGRHGLTIRPLTVTVGAEGRPST